MIFDFPIRKPLPLLHASCAPSERESSFLSVFYLQTNFGEGKIFLNGELCRKLSEK
jgi:hypothetical protein